VFKLAHLTWIIAVVLMSFSSAKAFNDSFTTHLLNEAKEEISSATTDKSKLEALEHFKENLFQRLNNFTIPMVEDMPDNDPRLLEIASLNEFDLYIDGIKFQKKITSQACFQNARKIYFYRGHSDTVQNVPSEALKALDLLDVLCKGK